MVELKFKWKELNAIKFLKDYEDKDIAPSLFKHYLDTLALFNDLLFPRIIFVLKEYPRVNGIYKTMGQKTPVEIFQDELELIRQKID